MMFMTFLIKTVCALCAVFFYTLKNWPSEASSKDSSNDSEDDLIKFGLFEKKIKIEKGETIYFYQATLKSDLHVSFNEKIAFHQFYKKIGLLSYFNIGLEAFDERIYVLSDETEVKALLSNANYKIASLILYFFVNHRDAYVLIRNQMIEININGKKMNDESLKVLSELRDEINQSSDHFVFKRNDKTYINLLIVEAIFGLLISQGCASSILFFNLIYEHFDLSQLFIRSVPLYFGFVLFSVILIKLLLRSSALISEILTEITFLFFVLYPFLAVSTISDINIYFDHSSAKSIEVKLIDKSRGAAEFFYLPNPNDPNDIVKFEVFKKTWDQAKVGDTILVWQKAGYLNIPYITDFEVKTVKTEEKINTK